jgi:hypothetical protein
MKEHNITALNNFIGGWVLDDLSICDRLIEYHKTNPDKFQGETVGGVNLRVKDSTDCYLTDPALYFEYAKELQGVLDAYMLKYKWCNEYSPWNVRESIYIQHYKPTGGYHGWHAERSSNRPGVQDRHLVFMTYLNDVTEGGETEWFYQELKVQPRKGLTVIWPADWTFTHRGLPSMTQEKYIVTGWLSYTS